VNFREFLEVMAAHNASDSYLTVDSPPMYRIQGMVQPIGATVFTPQDLEVLAQSIMNERQRHEFTEHLEMNLALSSSGLSRFRVNVFRQRGSIGMVIHKINVDIASIDALNQDS